MGILARRAMVMLSLLRSGREDVVLCLRIDVSGALSKPHNHKEKGWGQFEGTEVQISAYLVPSRLPNAIFL